MQATDVVIIGGGIIGTACAVALAQARVRVILVERLGLAAGASSACQSGIGFSPLSDDYNLRLDRAAIREYETLAEQGAPIDYSRCGALVVCHWHQAPLFRARLPHLLEMGYTCEWLDADALREAEPRLSPEITGAMLLQDMGQVSPMRVVNENARRAREHGATILTNTNVTAIEIAPRGVTAVITERERIVTEQVVICAGAWSRMVGQLAGLQLPVHPLKGHILVTEPAPKFLRYYISEAGYEQSVNATLQGGMPSNEPTAMPPQVATVLQPLPSGQILIGSSREFAGFDREVNRTRLAQLAQRAVKVAPAIGKLRIIRTYAGLRPWTPDGLPLIGATQQATGIILATGHAGEGNTRALVTGRLIMELFTGKKPVIDPTPLSPDRFRLN